MHRPAAFRLGICRRWVCCWAVMPTALYLMPRAFRPQLCAQLGGQPTRSLMSSLHLGCKSFPTTRSSKATRYTCTQRRMHIDWDETQGKRAEPTSQTRCPSLPACSAPDLGIPLYSVPNSEQSPSHSVG